MPVETGAARRTALLLLSLAALGAGAIHLAHAASHLSQWAPLGIGFYVAGVMQVAWAGAIVVSGSRRLLYVGAAFSAVFVLFYLVTRTVGMPVGPSAFQAEAFGRADLLCAALEAPVVLGALLLAHKQALRMTRRLAAVFSLSAVFVTAASGVALAAPAHHHYKGCEAAPVLSGVLDARGVDTGVTDYFRCKLLNSHHPKP